MKTIDSEKEKHRKRISDKIDWEKRCLSSYNHSLEMLQKNIINSEAELKKLEEELEKE